MAEPVVEVVCASCLSIDGIASASAFDGISFLRVVKSLEPANALFVNFLAGVEGL
jgi:hypothetical protein